MSWRNLFLLALLLPLAGCGGEPKPQAPAGMESATGKLKVNTVIYNLDSSPLGTVVQIDDNHAFDTGSKGGVLIHYETPQADGWMEKTYLESQKFVKKGP